MNKSPEVMLKEGAEAFSATLDSTRLQQLFKYKDLLLEWNQKMNLTAIEEEKDVIVKHFIDSFSILPCLRCGDTPRSSKGDSSKGEESPLKLIDIGTGAGFPGIPVKIMNERLEVVLLDSLAKRVGFLDTVIKELGLEKIKAVHGRAEEYGVKQDYREKFDVAVARAVANLPVLLEYCLPFVKTGGIFIAMKGSSTDEIESSNKALEILGGKIEEKKEFILPHSDIKRNIIIVKKYRQTPTKYPRKAGKPLKEPLI